MLYMYVYDSGLVHTSNNSLYIEIRENLTTAAGIVVCVQRL